jgi:N-acetylglucosamine kinase-like BadF-type ATPase
VLAALGLAQPGALVQAVYGRAQDREWLAGLARIAVEAADAGDPVACRIMDEAAVELAAMCCAVARQLRLHLEPPPLQLALTGGLLLRAPALQERLAQILRGGEFKQVEVRLVAEPVSGAVRLACDQRTGT